MSSLVEKLVTLARGTAFPLAGRTPDELGFTGAEERRFRELFVEFDKMELALKDYWKTCTAFLEVTGLVEEGVNKMTAGVLGFCSSLQENEDLRSLEAAAIRVREAVPTEEAVKDSFRRNLLRSMSERLGFFQGIRDKTQELAKVKNVYNKRRKELGKLRMNEMVDHVKLEELEMQVKGQRIQMREDFESLLQDLEQLYAKRAEVLSEPFDNLRRCQLEFFQQMGRALEQQNIRVENQVVIRSRSDFAQIVKQYYAENGRRIFERPPEFEQLHVSDSGETNLLKNGSELSCCYVRVSLFVTNVILQCQSRFRQQHPKMNADPSPEQKAAQTIQKFLHVSCAQAEAKRLASQIISIHSDQKGNKFYSNPHTGFISWTRPLFAPFD